MNNISYRYLSEATGLLIPKYQRFTESSITGDKKEE